MRAVRLASRLRAVLCEAQAAAPPHAVCAWPCAGHVPALGAALPSTDAHCPGDKPGCWSGSHRHGTDARRLSTRRRSIPGGTAEEQIAIEEACGVPHSDEEDFHHSQAGSEQKFDRRHGLGHCTIAPMHACACSADWHRVTC